MDLEVDYWIEYTLEHTLHALQSNWQGVDLDVLLADSTEAAKNYLVRHKRITGPGGAAVMPLEIAEDVDAAAEDRSQAVRELAKIGGGTHQNGAAVYQRVCSVCHQVGDLGKKFGPDLTGIATRMSKEEIIRSVLLPNEKISKGYETISVLTIDGQVHNGFVLSENEEQISIGISDGKQIDISLEDIELRKEMKASSMPEGLIKQIAPIEFLDLIAFLEEQMAVRPQVLPGGWIKAISEIPIELREHNGWKEISRDARAQVRRNDDQSRLAPEQLSLPDRHFESR